MLVLFDFDGTLVDSRRHVIAAMAQAFADCELRCPDDKSILATVGLQPEDMLAVFAPDLSSDTRQFIARKYRAHSPVFRRADPDLEQAFPEAHESLARLKAEGHRLGVVTGKSADGLNQSLDHFAWREYFDDLRPSDNAPRKPDPTLILRAMTAMGATAAETVMVGDTTFDMIMAKRAGVAAIGVGWGYHEPALLEEQGACMVVGSFAELTDTLSRGFGAEPG